MSMCASEVSFHDVCWPHSLEVTFHRAIDISNDPVAAVHACVRCGVTRVLSSGGAPNAADGVPTLRRMVEAAAGQLIVAAGGGVSESNCVTLATESGVDELHGSLRVTQPSAMAFRPATPIPMGAEKRNEPESEYETRVADQERVAAVASALGLVPSPRPTAAGSRRCGALWRLDFDGGGRVMGTLAAIGFIAIGVMAVKRTSASLHA